MLYTISKLRKSRIQRFKPCMIWSWNEEDMAFGRQLHHVKWPISQCEFHIAKISQGELTHDAKIWHFASWVIHLAKISQVTFYLAKFPLFLHARTTDFPDICSLIFSHVNSFCNLVFSRHKTLSCNFAIYRGTQCLQRRYWGIDPLYINLEIYKALFFSLLLFFPISIFLVAK